jgi:hypothetical protein
MSATNYDIPPFSDGKCDLLGCAGRDVEPVDHPTRDAIDVACEYHRRMIRRYLRRPRWVPC